MLAKSLAGSGEYGSTKTLDADIVNCHMARKMSLLA